MKWLDTKLKEQEIITSSDFYNDFGFTTVVGVGQAGMNALAGPIYVASVMLKVDHNLDLTKLKAKSLSERRIDKLATIIWDTAAYVRLGVISNLDIITRGKKSALQTALLESLVGISTFNPASCIIIDTIEMVPKQQFEGIPIITHQKISNRIDSVSAATIVAKQAQTAFMKIVHREFPFYGWDKNLGYSTKKHRQAIADYGWSYYHRIPQGEKI